MNPLNYLNPVEQALCNKADQKQIPIAGNIELLPLCNMDCKMCFAKMTRAQMLAHAPMRSWQEWLHFCQEAADMGMLFLLLTGGEPFLYPDFDKLYLALKKLGIYVSINSNGTLISEDIAKFLAQDPPRRINITLYGASDETYARLCGNPKGFTQVMNGVQLLRKYHIDVKFNCSVTPYNIDDLEDILRISHEMNIPIEVGYYMFPPVRENNVGNERYRLEPEAAALVKIRDLQNRMGEGFKQYVILSLEQYERYVFDEKKDPYVGGYTCRAGNSVFWVHYDGTLAACSFTKSSSLSIADRPFSENWKLLVDKVSNTYLSKTCHTCKKRIFCGRCASAAESETGDVGGVPEYYCRLTTAYIDELYRIKRAWEHEDNK